MFFTKNASKNLKHIISTQLGIQVTESNIIYLGNPLFIQINKTSEFLANVRQNYNYDGRMDR